LRAARRARAGRNPPRNRPLKPPPMKAVTAAVCLALCLSGCAVFKGRQASSVATSPEPWYPLATCANPHPDDIPAP
ncbi:MAG: hypothetical protein IK051_02510, partial [Rhodocyclaceae bacterium]|nr:hypothetical protein [Rhodocyclaceae bacterium]